MDPSIRPGARTDTTDGAAGPRWSEAAKRPALARFVHAEWGQTPGYVVTPAKIVHIQAGRSRFFRVLSHPSHARSVAATSETTTPNGAAQPGPWEKGGPSPNPLGRSSETAKAIDKLRKQAQGWTDRALAVLTDLMINKKVSAETRRKAANDVLDRAVGKAAIIMVGGDGEGPIQIDATKEMRDKASSVIAEALKKYAESQGDSGSQEG